MDEIRFRIEGQNPDEMVATIEAFLATEFQQQAARRPMPARASDHRDKADPVAVAGLILAIPGAILAAMDLAERVELKDKVERLLARIRDKSRESEGGDTKVFLEAPVGRPLDLVRASAADVLDRASAERPDDA